MSNQEIQSSFSLSEFIQSSLEQIVIGVANAQSSEALKSHGAMVNPRHINFDKETQGFYVLTGNLGKDTTPRVEIVQFDIAVSVGQENQVQAGGKGGVSIHVVSADVGKEHIDKNQYSNVSRLSFSVPLKLPDSKK